MVARHYWIDRIEEAWKKRPVIWLAGVRRVGKTYLCQSLPDIEYFDCELPRVRRMMEDPEGFLDTLSGKRIVLDEIHRLDNPSELLKIAADHYPTVRIVATGSSTLSASIKFKDTLAGRKRDLWLTPMCLRDLSDAKRPSLKHRLLRGGLPPFFLANDIDERDFQEWIDAYWAKLGDGGKELGCGWIKDKFGLCWQVVPAGFQEWIRRPAGMRAMMKMMKFDIATLKAAAEAE